MKTNKVPVKTIKEPEEILRDPASQVEVARYGDDAGASGAQRVAREVDTIEWERMPSGRLVKKLRKTRKVEGTLERMLRLGTIDEKMFACGEKYSRLFYRAHSVSGVTLFEPSIKSSVDPMTEKVIEARQAIAQAMDMVGRGSVGASCLWFVIGWGETINEWAARQRKPINERVASGILIGALSSLAVGNFA